MTEHALELITDTDREVTNRFMKMNEYLDVLIPRGGAGLDPCRGEQCDRPCH